MKKNIKDKLFELKITDDMEDESGIQQISLVDVPAIEVNWVAFSKEKEHEFHIPDGEDDSFLERLLPYGQDEQLLFDEGFEIDSIYYINKDSFINSYPNRPSEIDTQFFRYRYKYVLNPQASGQPVTKKTRKFCKDLIQKNQVFRLEDMLGQQNEQGSSFADWRGGYNCRHIFAKIVYKKKGYIDNDASGKREDGYDILGHNQNDTRTSHPSFSSEEYFSNKPKVSVDYDGVLSTPQGEDLVKELVAEGNEVYIVTGRNELEGAIVNADAKRLRIPQPNVLYTNGKSKVPILKGIGVSKHYDNNQAVLDDIKKNAPGVQGIKFDLNVGGLPPYVDQLPKKQIKKKLEGNETEFDYLKSKQDMRQSFSTDLEKRTIIGPAMIPDMNIFRKDMFGNPYYVFFSEDTIKLIAEKYMRNKYLDNNDLMHDGKAVNDVYVVESWIIEDPKKDKSIEYGFDLPKGTWMVMMKCAKTPEGDKVWSMIKNNELRGFSVSGFFIEEASNFRDELFLKKVAEILKNI